jgi:hypothetical protein
MKQEHYRPDALRNLVLDGRMRHSGTVKAKSSPW